MHAPDAHGLRHELAHQIAAGSDAEPMHLARVLADHSMHVELT